MGTTQHGTMLQCRYHDVVYSMFFRYDAGLAEVINTWPELPAALQLAVTIDQDTADGKVTGQLFIDGKPGNQAAIANQP